MSNIKIFDVNYVEYNNNITGTNLNTATALYAYDNHSDKGLCEFSTQTGSFECNWLSSTFFYIKDFFLNNTNIENGSFSVHTGTSWSTIVSFVVSGTSHYYSHASTIQAYKVGFSYTTTQDSISAYVGEFVSTVEKFSLNCNPSRILPKISDVGQGNNIWDGAVQWNGRETYFSCDLDWGFLQGTIGSVANTDLENMTELSRQKPSFLLWLNGNTTTYPDIRPWRKEDLYKCKLLNNTTYEPVRPNLIHVINAKFSAQEVV